MTISDTTTPVATRDRTPQRVRHEVRFRVLEVQRVQHVTPHLVRITLHGQDLDGFTSLGFDDHVKLFFPEGGTLVKPTMGPDGLVFPGGRPPMRDYTPRRYNAAARTLELDFAVHDAGPATDWAINAKVGQTLGVAGPRGSFVVPTDFDGHVLIGDDTALPAIERRLRELPSGTRAFVLAEVDSEADELLFESDAELTVKWVHRKGAEAGSTTLLADALQKATLPEGDVYAWVACESATAKALRAVLVGTKGLKPSWVKAAGYWRRGSVATHDKHED